MSGSLRGNVGKKGARQVRTQGMVPVALYGGEKQILLAIDDKQLQKAVFTPHVYLIQLDVEGKKHQAVVKDIQFHPVTDTLLHVDLLEVIDGKPITVSLPVKIEGSSEGVLKGGKLVKKFRALNVKALAKDMPEHITINITKLDINDSVKVGDLKHDKLTFLDMPSAVIVSVQPTRAAAATAEEAKGGK